MFASPLDESALGAWKLAFGLALMGLLAGLGGLLYRRTPALGRAGTLGGRLLLLLLAAILLADGIALASSNRAPLVRFGLALGLVAAAMAGLHWFLSHPLPHMTSRLPVGLLLVGLATTGWLTYRFTQAAELPRVLEEAEEFGVVVEVLDARAYTDRGASIPLYTRAGAAPTPLKVSDRPPTRIDPCLLEGQAVQVAPPDYLSICHGWTFTGGRHMITEQSVEMILRDNGYQEVDQPRPGDLIIYRDQSSGQIVHSGIVRAIGEEGYVLVESKWGPQGRYLHEAKVQGYSRHYTYYRSSQRKGHLLLGLFPVK
jgi:hypothetical protein